MKIVMKKLLLLVIIAFSCFAFAAATYKSADVSAAVVGGIVYSDSFDSADGKVSSDWITFGGAGIKTDYTAMRLNSDKYEWDAHVVYGRYKLVYDEIETSCTVEFTLNKLNDGGSWLGFSYGVDAVSNRFPLSSGAIIFYAANYANVFESNGANLTDDTTPYDLAIFQNKKVRVSVEFLKDKGEANCYCISVKCYDAETEEVLSQSECRKVLIRDGYFGFNTHTIQLDMFDFNIYENDSREPVFSDDFSDSAISYEDSVFEGGEPDWYANSYWNTTNLIIGNIGRLDISEAGSGVVYKEPVANADDKGLNVLYTLSAEFYIDEMVNADSGFIIGADSLGEGGAFIGVRKVDSQFSVLFLNGDDERLYACDLLAPSVSITVKVYYDNTAETIIDGNTYYFELNSVGNYLGIKTYGKNGGKGAYVDNFSYENNEYVNRTSPDAKVNFQDTMAGKYYYSTKYWYAGEGTSLLILPPSQVPDSYMIFTNTGEFSCFAPKSKYTDFILRFDITFGVKIQLGSMIGIEVGKGKLTDSLSNSVYIGLENRGDVTYCRSNKCITDEGFSDKPLFSLNGTPENIFTRGDTYTFMFIVNNGTVKIFVKNATEDDSILAHERVRFVNVPTDGYVAMFASLVDVNLDNFSIVNLDCEYFGDDYDGDENLQTFRYDFVSTTDFSAISGGTIKKDNTVEINYVSEGVATTGKVGANITRIKFADIESGAKYKHGKVAVVVNEEQGEITVSDGATDYAIKLEKDFVYKNALFEIEETLGKISVSFVSGDKPLAAMSDNVYEFEINNDLTAEKIYISSPYIATIKELSVFNLDTNISIGSAEYVQENVRTVKVSIQDRGCSGSMGGDFYAILALVTIAAVVMAAKRRKNNV